MPAGRAHAAPPLEIWTTPQHDGPNHLGISAYAAHPPNIEYPPTRRPWSPPDRRLRRPPLWQALLGDALLHLVVGLTGSGVSERETGDPPRNAGCALARVCVWAYVRVWACVCVCVCGRGGGGKEGGRVLLLEPSRCPSAQCRPGQHPRRSAGRLRAVGKQSQPLLSSLLPPFSSLLSPLASLLFPLSSLLSPLSPLISLRERAAAGGEAAVVLNLTLQ